MRSSCRLLTTWAFAWLLLIRATVAQDATKNADYLKGTNGVWSCTLQDTLNQDTRCDPSIRRRRSFHLDSRQAPGESERFNPRPSPCRCNNIYFNIWSACILTSNNNNTLPSVPDWVEKCKQSSTTFESNLLVATLGSIEVPNWAQVPVVGDKFDIMKAVLVAHQEWRTIQIVAPVISAVVAVIATCLAYYFWARIRGRTPHFTAFRSKVSESFNVNSVFEPSLKPVRREEPNDGWVIDQNEDPPSSVQQTVQIASIPEVVYQRAKLDDPDQGRPAGHRKDNSQSQQSKQTTHVDARPISALDLTDNSNGRTTPPPMSKWSDSDHRSHNLQYHTYTPQHSKRLPGSSTINTFVSHLKGVPSSINPFKSRPAPVKHVLPSHGFRLDDHSDKATETTFSTERRETQDSFLFGGTLGSGYRGQQGVLVNGHDIEDHDERLTLISNEERQHNRVFLISKTPGQDFSIHSAGTKRAPSRMSHGQSTVDGSNIQIITPSTTTSHGVPWKGFWRRQSGSKNESPASVPPAPKHPPPAAPPSTTNISTPRFPLANIEDRSTPKMKKPLLPTNNSSITVNTIRPSSPAPGAVNGPLFLQAPFRTGVYDQERYPARDDETKKSINGHHKFASESKISLSKTADDDNDGQDVRPPRPLSMQRTGSSTRTNGTGTLHPPTRNHGRGLQEDDAASFYLTPSSPPTHLRNLSQETLHPNRSNPELLFPSSVRAVGYSGGAFAPIPPVPVRASRPLPQPR
ncbi:hypothetical protein FA15DRAFT_673196 [Coprinopsis marcescibilis]|uniref:Uncharacterized protein n=1 Tax=Coprinopsis marcescibilis TaxID=230819 RepID=A0A5C3KK64_COPMA|nr:hypothetical protein FA15DRAFT_673196 [Coprinopsis marcescibilis]